MATAEILTPVPPPPPPPTIRLELTVEEAKTLLLICNYIGGDPQKSARGHMDSVAAALRDAGVPLLRWPAPGLAAVVDPEGPSGIYFRDTP